MANQWEPWQANTGPAHTSTAPERDVSMESTWHLPGVTSKEASAVQHVPPAPPRIPPVPSYDDLAPTVKRAAFRSALLPAHARRWHSVIVALAIFLIGNLAVQLNRNYFDAQSDGYFGMSRIQKCESLGRVPDVIFDGSSRAVYGLNGQLVDQTVQQQTGKATLSCNIATFGSSIDHDYYMFKKLIDDGYAPKILVENAWEYTINLRASGRGGNGFSAADSGSLSPIEGPNLANLSDLGDMRQTYKSVAHGTYMTADFALQRAVPLYGDRYGLLRTLCAGTTIGPCASPLPGSDPLATQRYLAADAQGYVALNGQNMAQLTPAQRFHAAHGQYTYGNDLANFTVGGHQIAYLHKLIELAQAHHVQVVLVTSPLNPTFFAYLNHPTDWNTLIVPFWQSIAAKYHIAYYDESQASGYTDADWWDPEHLDATGATKFSVWLGKQIIAPSL